MTLTITIAMDNAAFGAGWRKREVFRILNEAKETIVCAPGHDGRLEDVNGNTVGRWEVSE